MKVNKAAAIALAAHLFEFNGWLDKFGEVSLKHQEQLTNSPENEFNAKAIDKIALEIQQDFASEHWTARSQEGLYNYMMPTKYGGHITQALEMQLAMLTGAGVQQEINFA